MSYIKTSFDYVSYKTWYDIISNEWDQFSTALAIITNNKKTMFEEKLNCDNAQEWFRLILLTEVDWQLDWLEKTILYGAAIDMPWHAMKTGYQVTAFDLVDTVEGGINKNTRELFRNLRDLYEIIFLRKDAQAALDIFNELQEDKQWMQLNMVISCCVMGPMQELRPLLHYLVHMERYDIVRGMFSSATALHKEFQSETFLSSWLNMADNHGRTVLHLAALQQRQSWVKWFVSNGADVTLRDIYQKTAAHYMPDFVEIMNIQDPELLSELDISSKDGMLWALKHKARATFKHVGTSPDLIRLLVEHGGDPSTVWPNTNWCDESITEWLHCGGGGVPFYGKLLIEHGKKSPEFTCLLLALHENKNVEKWWNLCSTAETDEFYKLMNGVTARTEHMETYLKTLEKVWKKCNMEYKTKQILQKQDE